MFLLKNLLEPSQFFMLSEYDFIFLFTFFYYALHLLFYTTKLTFMILLLFFNIFLGLGVYFIVECVVYDVELVALSFEFEGEQVLVVVPLFEHLLVLSFVHVDFRPDVDDVVHENVLLQQPRYLLKVLQSFDPHHLPNEVPLNFRDSGVGEIRSLIKCYTVCPYDASVFVTNYILFLFIDFITNRYNTFLNENNIIKLI